MLDEVQTPLNELPVDVLDTVFNHLDVLSLLHCTLVCKAFRRQLQRNSAWKTAAEKDWGIVSGCSDFDWNTYIRVSKNSLTNMLYNTPNSHKIIRAHPSLLVCCELRPAHLVPTEEAGDRLSQSPTTATNSSLLETPPAMQLRQRKPQPTPETTDDSNVRTKTATPSSEKIPTEQSRTQLLATTSNDNTIRIWALKTPTSTPKPQQEITAQTNPAEPTPLPFQQLDPTHTLQGHSATPLCVVWVAHNVLATGGWDRRVCLWKLQTVLEQSDEQSKDGQIVEIFAQHRNVHKRGVMCIHPSRIHHKQSQTQHLVLVSGSAEGRVVVWLPPSFDNNTHHRSGNTTNHQNPNPTLGEVLAQHQQHFDNDDNDVAENNQPDTRNICNGVVGATMVRAGERVVEICRLPQQEVSSDGLEVTVGILAMCSDGTIEVLRATITNFNKPDVAIEVVPQLCFCVANAIDMVCLRSTSLQQRSLFALTQGNRSCHLLGSAVPAELLWEMLLRGEEHVSGEPLEILPGMQVVEQPRPGVRVVCDVHGVGQGVAIGLVFGEDRQMSLRGLVSHSGLLEPGTHEVELGASWDQYLDHCDQQRPRLAHRSQPNKVACISASCDTIVLGCNDGTVHVFDFHSNVAPVKQKRPAANPRKRVGRVRHIFGQHHRTATVIAAFVLLNVLFFTAFLQFYNEWPMLGTIQISCVLGLLVLVYFEFQFDEFRNISRWFA